MEQGEQQLQALNDSSPDEQDLSEAAASQNQCQPEVYDAEENREQEEERASEDEGQGTAFMAEQLIDLFEAIDNDEIALLQVRCVGDKEASQQCPVCCSSECLHSECIKRPCQCCMSMLHQDAMDRGDSSEVTNLQGHTPM